jgi:hypothetical protein
MKLHDKQWDALELAKVESTSAYLGGIRSGKTITGAHFALWCIGERPQELGGIFSNTNKQLQKATLKEFKGVLANYGIYENSHYVVNKNPEGLFSYRSKFSDHEGVWSFWNKAQVFCFSLETQIRGIELGYVWGDEIQDAKLDELQVVMGRMSGSKDPKTFYTLTPPKDNPDIDEMIYGDNAIPLVIGTTYDNAKNLPNGYLSELQSRYDPLTFAREVMCERKPQSGLNWLYVFDRNKHVSEAAKYQETALVYLSFDFNNNPFVCTLSHRGDLPGKKHGYIHYFDTVVIDPDKVGGLTYFETIAKAIELKIPFQYRQKRFLITGDASGKNQSILSRVGENIWSELLKELRASPKQLILARKNPLLKDSRILLNSIFSNYDEVIINPKCRELIRDCEFVKAKPDDSILKDNRKNVTQQADLIDALRYDVHAFNGDFLKRV